MSASMVNGDTISSEVSVPSALYDQLLSAAAAGTFTVRSVLLSVFQEFLRRYTAQPSATVDLYRNAAFLCRTTLSDNPSIRQLAERRELDALSQEGAAALRVTARADGQFIFADCAAAAETRNESASPVQLRLVDCDATLSGRLEWTRDAGWALCAMESAADHLLMLLRSALSNLDAPASDLAIVLPSDLEAFERCNDTAHEFAQIAVYDLFENRVREAPDAPAVTFNGETRNYRLLSDQVNQFAAGLRALGVGPGTLVGVNMDRSAEMVVALLAIFKARAAYLPLDPKLPPERLEFMQADSKPAVIVTQAHLRPGLRAATAHVICFDFPSAEPASPLAASERPAADSANLDDLAYVLYTSGSTGKPKGVQITQRAVSNFLAAMNVVVPLDVTDVVLATTTITFDISVFEIFGALTSGAHLVVTPQPLAADGELLGKLASSSGATVLQATPSGWRILLDAGWQGAHGLRMITGGEPLDRQLASQLLARGAALWNLYGPTETTVYATGKRIGEEDARITIGRPLANSIARVLDHNKKLVPLGAIGELYLGGVQLGRGYLNRPDLTNERFIPDPYALAAGARLYRTGDLARLLANGEIDALGRIDNQVKLRGYRIELEEIEAVLDSHPAVRKSVAKVVDYGRGDQRLVAYLVAQAGAEIDETQLRAHALRSLPSYMVPNTFVAMPAFPLGPSGKVDRKALAAPAAEAEDKSALMDAGGDELERVTLDIWRKVLQIPALALDDNFFEVGGHSILAPRIFGEVWGNLGRRLPFGTLLEAPTPRQFAQRLREPEASEESCLVTFKPGGSLPALYLVHHLYGDVLAYRWLAESIGPARPVFGIQASTKIRNLGREFSIETVAAQYVKAILERQPAGPFHFAGFSSGAIMAFEMTRQLRAMGHEVGLLCLIDGDIPAPGPTLSRAARWRKIAARKACKIVFKFKDEIREGPRQFVMKRLRSFWLQWSVKSLEASRQSGGTNSFTMPQLLTMAERAYRPQPYEGSALLVRCHDEAWTFGPDPLLGWSTLIHGSLDVVDVPGSHTTAMSPAMVKALADVVEHRLSERQLGERPRAAEASQ
jgi:amino acid adenylation domain-containing protein